MRVVLSADLEGISQLRHAREILAACPEYWETGKPRFEDEVRAACEGLLAGGATVVVVLDNHGSGNPTNISATTLPDGARLETWNLWDVLGTWDDARRPIGAAMLAGFATLPNVWSNDLTSAERAAAYDPTAREWLGKAIEAWGNASEPEWFTEPAPALGER